MHQDINFSEYEKGHLERTQRGLSLSLFDPEYSAEFRVKLDVKSGTQQLEGVLSAFSFIIHKAQLFVNIRQTVNMNSCSGMVDSQFLQNIIIPDRS